LSLRSPTLAVFFLMSCASPRPDVGDSAVDRADPAMDADASVVRREDAASSLDVVPTPDAERDDVAAIDSGAITDRPAPSDARPPVGTAGCGRPAPRGVSNGSIVVGGVRRTYVLSVPERYDPSAPTPIVFGWHGNVWTGATFRPSIAVEASATTPAIFVYPDGLDVAGLPLDAAGGVSGTGWDWRRDGRDVALFDALLAELEGRFCIDPARRYSFGRSHGGFFAHALACARGDRLRASASVSAGAPQWVLSTSCVASLPVWMAHNANDGTVPLSLAQQARDRWLVVNDCSTTTRVDGPCTAYACSRADAQFCLSPSGNHEPPPFAGQRIWTWFETH
jgi:hypothetical protein